ncbi:VOC family protein [Limoniibacter endophyticus]|uniref:Bleomycin resistance protein n=1 Tax=Limoniibacter endophyticus TaxID=1565040 RepID=A0A8J3DP35_9HYPH|nr:VOC family protein [Limoniibacter endophyticus]GHC72824.1 bleomycin resistance protein [Limoniibacter endophyticus]
MGERGRDFQIDNIEFVVGNIGEAKAFFGTAFGWSFTDYGPTYSEFSDGRLTGGLTTSGEITSGGPLIILYCDDLEAAKKRVVEAGGKITLDTFAFPGGHRFQFKSPDGYEFAVWSARNVG